ncbi:MAG: type I methionyl aminopeptidase [Planctomycetaceae bacterium]|nr:type I methionyl aminopeptidase [Planctomycetaceae bacterium]
MVKKAPIYNERDRNHLREASRFNAELMDYIRPHVKAGVTTDELDRLAEDYTRSHGHIPACLGYKGYPKSICTSVNEVVCHGIPDSRPLQDGDIVNVDLTSIVDGWYGDQSETFLIGEVSPEARELVQITFEALWRGIRAIEPGGRINDIGQAIYHFARARGLEIVREYQGHGIGRQFHQEPGVPHFPDAKLGRTVVKPGMCFTIEPMLNIGTFRTTLDSSDGWTVRTADGALSAQFEHTILMTQEGPEILTLTKDGPQEGHVF